MLLSCHLTTLIKIYMIKKIKTKGGLKNKFRHKPWYLSDVCPFQIIWKRENSPTKIGNGSTGVISKAHWSMPPRFLVHYLRDIIKAFGYLFFDGPWNIRLHLWEESARGESKTRDSNESVQFEGKNINLVVEWTCK